MLAGRPTYVPVRDGSRRVIARTISGEIDSTSPVAARRPRRAPSSVRPHLSGGGLRWSPIGHTEREVNPAHLPPHQAYVTTNADAPSTKNQTFDPACKRQPVARRTACSPNGVHRPPRRAPGSALTAASTLCFAWRGVTIPSIISIIEIREPALAVSTGLCKARKRLLDKYLRRRPFNVQPRTAGLCFRTRCL